VDQDQEFWMSGAVKHNFIWHKYKIVYMGDFSRPEEMKNTCRQNDTYGNEVS